MFYWLAMKKDVDAYVSSCKIFQKIRMIVGHPRDYSNHFLCRYKRGKIPLLTSLMAFLTLPEKKIPLWIVDRLTRYAHFTALARPYSAESVAELFVEHVVQLHGIPR